MCFILLSNIFTFLFFFNLATIWGICSRDLNLYKSACWRRAWVHHHLKYKDNFTNLRDCRDSLKGSRVASADALKPCWLLLLMVAGMPSAVSTGSFALGHQGTWASPGFKMGFLSFYLFIHTYIIHTYIRTVSCLQARRRHQISF